MPPGLFRDKLPWPVSAIPAGPAAVRDSRRIAPGFQNGRISRELAGQRNDRRHVRRARRRALTGNPLARVQAGAFRKPAGQGSAGAFRKPAGQGSGGSVQEARWQRSKMPWQASGNLPGPGVHSDCRTISGLRCDALPDLRVCVNQGNPSAPGPDGPNLGKFPAVVADQ